ncbi:hypothetical protein GALMADRAFT_148546 [Galerina marginata CBS 339.88]|uniref:Uncharacterized protein n=1 Tax=Galerina marginata (strain CBS 339.88) TaxID=685588 RepID=A0A067SFU8_GALM3|nr:hypothetical protein GALMADRAFT_148546 [Galerina marginata CBS 339.88]
MSQKRPAATAPHRIPAPVSTSPPRDTPCLPRIYRRCFYLRRHGYSMPNAGPIRLVNLLNLLHLIVAAVVRLHPPPQTTLTRMTRPPPRRATVTASTACVDVAYAAPRLLQLPVNTVDLHLVNLAIAVTLPLPSRTTLMRVAGPNHQGLCGATALLHSRRRG